MRGAIQHVTLSLSEVPLGAGVPRLEVGVFIDGRSVADRVEMISWVTSPKRELLSQDVVVDIWPWIVEASEHPPWEQFPLPGGTDQ